MVAQGAVYTLKDPRTDEVRYVGATKNPKSRLNNHRHGSSNDDLAQWIDNVESDGHEVIMNIIEEAPVTELAEIEEQKIMEYDDEYNLLNRTDTSAYSPGSLEKKNYTSIRVSVGAKKAAEKAKSDDETWNQYVQRCTENPPEVREFVPVEDATGADSEAIAARVAEVFDYAQVAKQTADELEGRLR